MATTTSPKHKTERLMNLTMCLLAASRPLTKATIRRVIQQYAETTSDESFDKMFERDKDDLRELGIPLVTEDVDPFFDDEPGYRIDRRAYALPDVHFTADELAVLGLAGRAWTHAGLAGEAAAGLQKLRTVSGEEDATVFTGLEPRMRAAEPAFDALKDAVLSRRAVAFDYRSGGVQPAASRHLRPWSLVSYRDRWYVTGWDVDRGEPRVFRLSRITSSVRPTGRVGAYEVPTDHDPQAMIQTRFPDPEPSTAVLLVRPDRCHELRRQAGAEVRSAGEPGWDEVELPCPSVRMLADEVAAHGGDAVVQSPPELRAAVVARLQGALAAHGSPGGDPAAEPTMPPAPGDEQ